MEWKGYSQVRADWRSQTGGLSPTDEERRDWFFYSTGVPLLYEGDIPEDADTCRAELTAMTSLSY